MTRCYCGVGYKCVMCAAGKGTSEFLATDRSAQPKEVDPRKPRWPNTPAEHHARLDALLAAQVASGGQDCAPARSLIERADRVRREAEEREHQSQERYRNRSLAYTEHRQGNLKAGIDWSSKSGIASLRLERPLIAHKRRK